MIKLRLQNLQQLFTATKQLLSYELLMALFVFSGLYKGYSIFINLPVDITAILGIACLCTAAYMLLKRQVQVSKEQMVVTAAGLLFFLYMAISGCWSNDTHYALYKATLMLPTVVITFVGCTLIISSSKLRCARFIYCITLLAVVQSLVVLVSYVFQRQVIGLELISGDYLGAGYLVGLAWIAMYCRVVFSSLSLAKHTMEIVLLVLLSNAIMILGGKQNLLGIIFIIALTTVLPKFNIKRLGRTAIILAIVIPSIFLMPHLIVKGGQSLPSIYRLKDAVNIEESASVKDRISLATVAWEGWLVQPVIGHGLGSFNYNGDNYETKYPHNIIFEVLYEGGLIGLLLLLLLVECSIFAFRGQRLAHIDALGVGIACMFIFIALTMMVSNTYANSRSFFAIFALLSARRA